MHRWQRKYKINIRRSAIEVTRREDVYQRLCKDALESLLPLRLPYALVLLTCCQNYMRGHIRAPYL